MKNCCFSQKSPEKVDTSLEKSFEKIDNLAEKSLEKVCAIELKSLVKSFCFGYTMIIISISDGGNLMLKRKIEQRLIDWKNDQEHKQLIIN